MTGPEHYAEAELLLSQAMEMGPCAAADQLLAAAQVHATLAGVSATADEAYASMSVRADEAWREVTS
jgi:hypothetical protein